MTARKDLKTERYWTYQAEVEGSFMPNSILRIKGFELRAHESKDKGTIFIATLKIKEEDINLALRTADEKFAEIFDALSLATGGRYEHNIKSGRAFPRFEEKGKPSSILRMVHRLPWTEIMDDEETILISKQATKLLPLSLTDLSSDKVFQKALE